MDLNVQVEVGKCDFFKCHIFVLNDSKSTIKIKYLKAQLFNFAKSRRPNDFSDLEFIKKISDKEVLWNVIETKVLVSNLDMPSKSQGVVLMEECLNNWMPTFRGKSLQMRTKLRLELITDKIQKYLILINIEPLTLNAKTTFEANRSDWPLTMITYKLTARWPLEFVCFD